MYTLCFYIRNIYIYYVKYFNMMESYPQQLTFRDALVIRHEISISEIKPTDLPLFVMSKIITSIPAAP